MKQAHAHIEDLESRVAEPSTQGGFLDSMRGALFGQQQGGGSVPSVRPAEQRPVWNSGQVIDQRYQQDPAPMGGTPAAGMPSGGAGSGGGSFLGTAAAAAAGMIGGSLLMNSFRGMMGGGHNQAFGDGGSGKDSRSPFGTDQSGGDLARDAGLNDIGGGGRHADADNPRQGLFDQASLDDDDSDDDFDSDDFDSGDSDTA